MHVRLNSQICVPLPLAEFGSNVPSAADGDPACFAQDSPPLRSPLGELIQRHCGSEWPQCGVRGRRTAASTQEQASSAMVSATDLGQPGHDQIPNYRPH